MVPGDGDTRKHCLVPRAIKRKDKENVWSKILLQHRHGPNTYGPRLIIWFDYSGMEASSELPAGASW